MVEESKTANASIALDRGGTIVGRVTAEGRPLAEAQVMVILMTPMIGGFSPATTDANGEFTIEGLASGSHRIEARRNGYVPKQASVSVSPGKETRADIELARGRELRGRVVDASGRPVAQADITTRGAPGVLGFGGMATTDGDGAFKLTGLADRNYTLTARKEGFAESTADVNPETTSEVTITLSRGGTITGRILGVAPADLPFVEIRSIRSASRTQPDAGGAYTLGGVPDGDVIIMASLPRPRPRSVQANAKVVNGMSSPVDLDFSAGIAVRGRVTQQGKLIQGTITFMPVRPAPGAPFTSLTAEIARDGTYEVRVPAAGEYDVSVAPFAIHHPVKTDRVNVTGEMVHDVELRGTTLSGLVLDAATRQPVEGAQVMIVNGPGELRTNGAGRFTSDLIGDGKYELRVQAEGYAPEVRPLEIANGVAPEIEVTLSRGVTAMYRILDAATGQPIENAGILVRGPGSGSPVYWGATEMDATGMRRITLQPGTYQMTVFSNGYAPLTKPVTLTVPGPPLDVRLDRLKQP
jgi:hypothetical protein